MEDLRKVEVRPPIDEIKWMTQDDPTFALVFRTVIDKNIKADELLEWLEEKKGEKRGKDKIPNFCCASC